MCMYQPPHLWPLRYSSPSLPHGTCCDVFLASSRNLTGWNFYVLSFQQVTQQLQIQLSYADAVIGTSGSNISYTRRLSGATVTIQETRGVPGEMTVEVSGTGSQVQTAIQLIQVHHYSQISQR